ncbi:sugar phosphate isomerase/epimerase family protein [Chryseolinea lacunae]|uniref:Sugar phosphate isomerase/epimerase n=1 Tax=Chryseolinea lacunae TaxID=2801331 RepID=A0ABS1KVG0_9BACT|nr:sugar phosphate isomerase/epimerase [Chryseolinea lacunae]MBL0743217.1 sugar phosphate isomerase/epimerase [Chryseolinea lacunae]
MTLFRRINRLSVLILAFVCFVCVKSMAQEIGLELYSLRNQFAKDVPGTMAKIKAMGIKDIEMGETYGLEFPEFMKLLAINGLNVVSYGADFERLEKFPQKVADEARAYGARYVVCFWIPHDGDTFTAAEVEKAAAVFNAAGRVMAMNGLLLCYHPHGYEFKPYNDGTLFDYMVTKFDSRFVHFEMDVFWVKQPGQDPVKLLRKYPSRFILLHLKDRKKGTPNSDNGQADVESNVTLGTGDVGIAEIVQEAKKNGIKHFFIEDESSRSEEQIPKSIAFLKSLP